MADSTIIKNALLFDGKGSFPVYKDVAFENGVITKIEDSIPADGFAAVVDASGQWLMPGLLDIHTHLDIEVEVSPGLGEAVRHGTTTVVVGNCSLGTSFGKQTNSGVGANPIVDCFARVESMPKDVLEKCIANISWNNTGDYLDHFKNIPLGPNVVALLPHSMLRIEAMGLEAAISRKASEQELNKMCELVDDAMQQGYAGLSLDSLPFHYLSNDPHKDKRIPTQMADRKEIFPLMQLVRQYDRVMQTTPDVDNLLNFIRRLFWSSARLYKQPMKISALTAMDFPAVPSLYKVLLGIASLVNSKLFKGKLHFQALPTNFRTYANGVDTPIFEELKSTRQLIACEMNDRKARLALMNDPVWEQQYRKDMIKVMPDSGRLKPWQKPLTFLLTPTKIVIDSAPIRCWAGDTVADILARLKNYRESEGVRGAKDSEEAAFFARMPASVISLADFYLYCLKEFDREFRWWTDVANTRPELVRHILFHQGTLPGFNDSGAHISSLAFYDGNLMTLKIAQACGLQKVAQAVKRLSSEPAEFFSVDAGVIKLGAQADLVLINPEALRRYDTNENRQRVYVDHFEMECLVNRSNGVVDQVYINGERVWEKASRFTSSLGTKTLGRVLRSQSSRFATAL